MQISWWTIALQAVNFLVLVWLLWRVLYRPVRDIIEARKKVAEDAFVEAENARQAAAAEKERFEKERARLDQEREEVLKKAHDEAAAERAAALEQAKAEAERMREAAQKAADEERAVVLKELRGEIADAAGAMAAELLRKMAGKDIGNVSLARIEAELDAMPSDELARLRGDLASDGAELTVVTAAPLDPADQENWSTRLTHCMQSQLKPNFISDPEIIGGAELRFPHAVLKFSWAEQLVEAKRSLVSK